MLALVVKCHHVVADENGVLDLVFFGHTISLSASHSMHIDLNDRLTTIGRKCFIN